MNNKLIVIENGRVTIYSLDDKLAWTVGRPSKDSHPDIRLHSATVSRRHGTFQNMDGVWFYLDNRSKNGTIYNNSHIKCGLNGRVKPVMLEDGDTFIFGAGEESVISHKTVWAMYISKKCDVNWKIVDTKDVSELSFVNGENTITYNCPMKGTVVRREEGLAIYMGDVTYLFGNMEVSFDKIEERNSYAKI